MNTELITGPLIGAIIGLFTNGVAIKMLFRPLKPIYLDKNKKYRVPFTPGLIPKEKSRLASAIGRIISTKLLDSETIKKAILSEEVHYKIVEKVEKFVDTYKTMDCSVGDFLKDKEYLQLVDEKEILLKVKFSGYVTKKLLEANIGKVVVDFAMEELSKKIAPMFMNMITKTLNVDHLAEKIDTIAEERVPSIVGKYVDKEYSNIKDKSVGEIVTNLVNIYPTYAEKVWELYKKVVEEKATQIIKEFNIAKIIEDKINEFDMEELERLVMEISKKELDALVWLGGLLGAIMGIFNAII